LLFNTVLLTLSAIALNQLGFKPEIVDERRNEVSEGLYLPISAMKIYKKLGIADDIERSGTEVITNDQEELVCRAEGNDPDTGTILKLFTVHRDSGFRLGKVNFSRLSSKYNANAVGIDYAALLKVWPSFRPGRLLHSQQMQRRM
jgi:hypothetical protein